jgi:septal ring factor EnvC (AmiA/AmiB activator)
MVSDGSRDGRRRRFLSRDAGRRRRFLPGLLSLVLGVGAAAFATDGSGSGTLQDEIARETQALERIREQLVKAREEAAAQSQKEAKFLSALNSVDAELVLKDRLLAGLSRQEGRLIADLEETQTELTSERDRLEGRREILRRRLRNIYKVGERPGLQVLLGATSAVDLIRRFDWLLLVAAQDRLLCESIQESIAAVSAVEEELARKLGEVRAVREESRREHAELSSLRQKRQELLVSAQREKKRQEQLVQEYEQSEKEVQELLTELEERARLFGQVPELPPEGTGFAEARGRLPWPVQGKVIRWFGIQKESRFGTSTFNGGIDIRAPQGAEVLAVHRGRADYVNWLPGYGQCIILNHGSGYYTLYAHTSRVFVTPGDFVATGDVIATVGDTGSLLGEVLHFEIRKDAEPLNPAPWLEAVRLR